MSKLLVTLYNLLQYFIVSDQQ